MSSRFSSRVLGLSSSVGQRWRWFLAKPRGVVAPGRVAMRAGYGAHDAMPMSEWIYLGGLLLAILWTRSQKFLHLDAYSVTRHLPGMVVLVGFLLTLLAGSLFFVNARLRTRAVKPSAVLWPLLLLALLILAGSIYAQAIDDERNTWRNAGMYMLSAYFAAHMVHRSPQPSRLVGVYLVLIAVAAVAALLAMIPLFFATALSPFHQIEFFILPLVVYVATRKPHASGAETLLLWGLLACAVFFRKNTGYLVALGTIAYLWAFHWRVNRTWEGGLRRALLFVVGLLLVVAAVLVYTYLRQTGTGFVPSGNIEFRVLTYTRAYEKFLDSPLWGDAYSNPSVEKFEAYDTGVANNILPTHSDLMDLLAHGGLVGLTLWLMAHVVLLSAVHRHLLSRQGEIPPGVFAAAHTLTCMVLLSIVTYAFNPMWQYATGALLMWTQFGMLAGLVCQYARAAAPKIAPYLVRT